MKGLPIAIGLLAVAALSSCSIKEELPQQEPAPRFHAVIEQPNASATTKAYVDKEIYDATGKYNIFWYEDDRVSIFYDKTYNQEYKFLDRDGSTAGDFGIVSSSGNSTTSQAIGTGSNYAIFPYHRDNRCDTDGNLTVVIPEKQAYYSADEDYRGIGARLLMVAKDSGGDRDFFFKHVACYIGIRLLGDGISVKSITFRGNNSEVVAGFPIVSFDENDDPVMRFDPRDRDNSKFISMELSEPKALNSEKYESFWLIVPPIAYENGFTITVKDVRGGVFVKEVGSITLERKKFYTVSTTVEITTIPVESVSVSSETLEMKVGDEASLEAAVLPEAASDKTVTWSSSNPDVATVDGEGHVTAVAAGTATITVTTTDGGKTATCTVTVKEKVYPVETVTLDKEALVLFVGEAAVALTATISPDNATNKNVTWTSSDPNVATVDENGNVTAVAVGTASITVKTEDGNKTDECAVTVKAHVASVSLDKTTLEMFVGGEPVSLTATVSPENASDKSVTWASSAPAVATVENGTITPVAAGSATITVTTTDGEKTATCTVTVKDVITYSLAIDPAENAEVNAGSEFTFKLMLTTTTNGVVGEPVNVAANATWTSSDDAFATIANGVAKGVKEGSVTITAKYTTPDDVEKTLTAPLKVNKNPNQAGDDVPIGGGGNF